MSGSPGAELHNLFAGRGVGGCVMVRSRQVPGRMHGGTQRRVVRAWPWAWAWACRGCESRVLLAKRREIEDSWLHGWDGRLRDTIAPKRSRWVNDMTTAQKSGLPAGVNELERTRQAWWGGALAAKHKQQHKD